MALVQSLLLLSHTNSHGLDKFLHLCIKLLFMGTVRTAIAFPVPMVVLSGIFHKPPVVPVPDHRHADPTFYRYLN